VFAADTRAVNFLCCGASLARQAIKEWRNESGSTEQVFVAGSIGPYGTTYSDGSEYHGRYVDTEDREACIFYIFNKNISQLYFFSAENHPVSHRSSTHTHGHT
jgi:S-methylmethionine-dependent homocysteine/selenocysteine methylase